MSSTRTSTGDADVVVVGAGIVGLATARALDHHGHHDVVVVDKEPRVAHHQSGRNSGVVHSGIYYPPGSAKARLVAEGRRRLVDVCRDHDIPLEFCGKVVVAVDDTELGRLAALEERARANGITVERLGSRDLSRREPHIAGVGALHVPSAGITDFARVARALADEHVAAGGTLLLGEPVTGIRAHDHGVDVVTPTTTIRARSLVNCAGLQADRLARLSGADTRGVRIMAFRGEYAELVPDARHLVRHLVYPVPDPALPFLGVHLTRMVDGSVHAGPNAVVALAREGYRWRDVSPRDTAEVLVSARTWRLARRYWRTGLGEIHRSVSTRAFVAALRRLCPDLRADDLAPCGSGVRAQAIDPAGRLLDDFAFADGPRSVHVVNAPSPAATASLAIGAEIAARHERLVT